MSAKLTVLITCKNEERHIVDCIRSVRRVADEILVADSGSTDRTLELVSEQDDCTIIERDYRFPADFKNWAIPQASHRWVLIVDADERLTEELAASIKAVLADPSPEYAAYRIGFDCYFFGRHLKHAGWNTEGIRLIRRECRYKRQPVHEEIDIPKDRTGRLKGRFLHYSIDSYDQYFEKYIRYTRCGAQTLFRDGKRASFFSLFFRPWLRFFLIYVIRGGFLDGLAGLQACMLTAFFNTFVKQARLWELHLQALSEDEPAPIETNDAIDDMIVPFPQPADAPTAADPESGWSTARVGASA